MIERCVLIISLCFAVTSCSTNAHGHVWDLKALSSQPTPPDWKTGAIWTFVTTKKSGSSETLTFRVTNELAKTCESGVWRKLQLVDGNLPAIEGEPSQPAFSVEGRFLWISLFSNWCDLEDHIRGELQDKTFKGDRTFGGPMGSGVVGSIRGWRVK
jgi:hypothetical protein